MASDVLQIGALQREQGAVDTYLPSGNSLTAESGSTVDLAGTIKIGGVAMTATAAELNAIAGNGLSATELGVLDGVTAGTATASKALVIGASKEIATITSATITTLTCTGIVRAAIKHVHGVSNAKVGATAGWVVGAAANVFLATLPQSQSGSTLVIPIQGLKVGDTITGFGLIGQVESAGGAVTIDANLRSQTSAAADITDASVASITQIAVSADTAVNATQDKGSLTEVVTNDKTYYLLITATTAATTDIALAGFAVTVTTA